LVLTTANTKWGGRLTRRAADGADEIVRAVADAWPFGGRGQAMQGLFNLKTPRDLLAKLRHDFERLDANGLDACAAFDFFVTARHLPEWLYPKEPEKRRALFDCEVLLRVCAHIADGSKHFEASSKRHASVKDTVFQESWIQEDFVQADFVQTGGLFVNLDGDAAIALGATVEVRELARRVLTFWESYPALA
jgi:hypothetical protein